jgi:hypothetical protein
MKEKGTLCVALLFALILASDLFAEPGTQNANQYRRNYYMDLYANTWRMNISVGGQIFYGEDDLISSSFKRIAPAFSFSVNREVSQWLGARIKFTGGQHVNYISKRQPNIKFSSMGVSADLMLNLNRIFSEEQRDEKPKYWLFVGGGAERSFETVLHEKYNVKDRNFGLFNLGIYSQIPMNEKFDLSAELKGSVVGEAFDGQIYQLIYEGFGTLLVGFTYHF